MKADDGGCVGGCDCAHDERTHGCLSSFSVSVLAGVINGPSSSDSGETSTIRYSSPSHLPRSTSRQRTLQKGNAGLPARGSASRLQIGQRAAIDLKTVSATVEKRTLLFLLLLMSAGCREGTTKNVDPLPPEPTCGDGNISLVEDCEGSNLRDATCKSLGFDEGQLTCANCKFVKSQCSKRCGNDSVDPGEECDGKRGVGACATFGYQACTAICRLDASHCVPVLFQTGAALSAAKGGPALIADLEPKGLGDLVMAVQSFGRLETFGYLIEQGFVAGRKLSYGRAPLEVAAGDIDGDGRMDVLSINDDGAIDRYLYSGTSFAFATLADAGCPASQFLGTTVGLADAGATVFALGCADAGAYGAVIVQRAGQMPVTLAVSTSAAALGDVDGDGRSDLLFVSAGALQSRLAPAWALGPAQALPAKPLAIAVGDLDGDGDLDLAALEPQSVQVWENTSAGFAQKLAYPVTGARDLKVVDLDLDGRPDLIWQLGDKAQARRNQGGWSFATTEGMLGPGAPISMAVGDADGDGDLDVASTHSAGGEATMTYVLVNKVR